MQTSFQTFIINMLATLLFIILGSLVFLIVDRLVLEGQFTGRYNKTKRIETLVKNLNEVTETNQTLKNQLSQISTQTEKAQEVYNSNASYKITQTLEKLIGKNSSIKLEKGHLTFKNQIFFESGSTTLTKRGQEILDQIYLELSKISVETKDIPWILRVEGHTDSQVSHTATGYSSNWLTSYKRALMVVEYLVSKGIDAGRFYVAGFSSYHPLSPENNLKENRRAALIFDYV